MSDSKKASEPGRGSRFCVYLTDTRELGVECFRILPSRFSLKYIIRLGILGHLIKDLQTKRRPSREPRGNSQQIWWDRLVIG